MHGDENETKGLTAQAVLRQLAAMANGRADGAELLDAIEAARQARREEKVAGLAQRRDGRERTEKLLDWMGSMADHPGRNRGQ